MLSLSGLLYEIPFEAGCGRIGSQERHGNRAAIPLDYDKFLVCGRYPNNAPSLPLRTWVLHLIRPTESGDDRPLKLTSNS